MNEDERILSIPVAKIFCYDCNKEYGSRNLVYTPVIGLMGSYRSPFCPGCGHHISFDRLKIDSRYEREAIKKSTEFFLASGKNPEDHQMRFITIFYQGGVSGCAAVWPKSMRSLTKSKQLDSYISRIFKISSYARTPVPREFDHNVPFKFVYVEVSESIKRVPIANFRLN